MTRKSSQTRSIGRKRTALGWTLLALGTLIAALWLASGWWSLGYFGSRATTAIAGGQLYTRLNLNGLPSGVHLVRINRGSWIPSVRLWLGIGIDDSDPPLRYYDFGLGSVAVNATGLKQVYFVLWPLPLLLWATGAASLRSGLRISTGECTSCNYDLTGLAAGAVCPECGKSVSATATAEGSAESIARAPRH